MVCYVIGGALGAAIGSAALAHWHWTGVCLAGDTFSLIGFLVLFTPWPPPSLRRFHRFLTGLPLAHMLALVLALDPISVVAGYA
jgi:bacteriorhodopsin